MKYGVLFNKNNMNIGDDIQAYATSRFLPSIDYFIDREHIDEFKTDDEKAVAVIMNAWYMWAKWNWPPSKYIYPHFVGFHYADHQLAHQIGTPVKFEFLDGLGKDYMNAYGPIGCRDKFTLNKLQEMGIDSYFIGCITLTLPKMPETKDKGTYICIVDVDKVARDKLVKMLGDKIEIREFSHDRPRQPDMSWDDRVKMIEERLTIYQNARCVISKRLHCVLPCLAMDVPVFLLKYLKDDIRFDPYYDLLHKASTAEFMADDYNYDFLNPPENKKAFIEIRDNIEKSCREFIEYTKGLSDDPNVLCKTTYTENELEKWRHDTMKKVLDIWLYDRRTLMEESRARKAQINVLNKQQKELNKTVKELKENKKTLKEKNLQLKDKKSRLKDKVQNLENELKQTKKELEIEKNRSLKSIIKSKVKKKLKK